MANSIFVGYELDRPDYNYEGVLAAIKSCGAWAHVKTSLFFITTELNARAVFDRVRAAQQSQDKLIVIDPGHNHGIWVGLHQDVSDFLKTNWH